MAIVGDAAALFATAEAAVSGPIPVRLSSARPSGRLTGLRRLRR
jgi:hypothetical protein